MRNLHSISSALLVSLLSTAALRCGDSSPGSSGSPGSQPRTSTSGGGPGGSTPTSATRNCPLPSATTVPERTYHVDYENRGSDDFSITGLYPDGDFLYVQTYSGIYKAPSAGGDVTKLSDRIFEWGASGNGKIYGYARPDFVELNIANHSERVIGSAPDAVQAGYSAGGMSEQAAFDGEAFYYLATDDVSMGSQRIARMGLDGSKAVVKAIDGGYRLGEIKLDGEYIYWQNDSAAVAFQYSIFRTRKNGEGEIEEAPSPGVSERPFAISGGQMIYSAKSDKGESALERMNYDSKAHERILEPSRGTVRFGESFASGDDLFGLVLPQTDITGMTPNGNATIWSAKFSGGEGAWYGCRQSLLFEDPTVVTADAKYVYAALLRDGKTHDDRVTKVLRWDR